jgi:hypothetical protein
MGSVRRFGIGVFACAVAFCALPGAARAEGSIKLLRSLGFAEESFVRPEVKSECKLESRLPQWIQEYAHGNGIQVELVDALPKSGRVLEVQIADTIETGNAWTGRQKGLEIRGRLFDGGELVGSFRGRRMTMGGFMGGYKGACSFFGRCAKTLGRDVADWLKAPAKDSMIGG